MKRTEYLTELMKKDVELINDLEENVREVKSEIEDELKKAEEKCDLYEEMYPDDFGIVLSAYTEYENIRSELTELESALYEFKIVLIDHYEKLLIEKRAYNTEIGVALAKSRVNVIKLDETVEIIKGVLI